MRLRIDVIGRGPMGRCGGRLSARPVLTIGGSLTYAPSSGLAWNADYPYSCVGQLMTERDLYSEGRRWALHFFWAELDGVSEVLRTEDGLFAMGPNGAHTEVLWGVRELSALYRLGSSWTRRASPPSSPRWPSCRATAAETQRCNSDKSR